MVAASAAQVRFTRGGYCKGRHFFRLAKSEPQTLMLFRCGHCGKGVYVYRDKFWGDDA